MDPNPNMTFATVVRHAIRRARLAQQIRPTQLARRMAALGYPWHPQTVSNVESGRRRVPADELLALGLALEVSVSHLLRPYGGLREAEPVVMPGGGVVLASAVAGTVGEGRHQEWVVAWDADDQPHWPSEETLEAIADVERQLSEAQTQWQKFVAQFSEIYSQFEPESRDAEIRARTDEYSRSTKRLRRLREGLIAGRSLEEIEAEAEQKGEG